MDEGESCWVYLVLKEIVITAVHPNKTLCGTSNAFSIIENLQYQLLISSKRVNLLSQVITKSDGMTINDEEIVRNMTQFRNKTMKEGTIDVYW